jgi:hypothetical protein
VKKALLLLLCVVTLFSGVVFADGEWKPYLDILVWSNPPDLGIRLQTEIERHFPNIASYLSVVTPASLREPLQYNGYNVICLLGCTKAGQVLDVPEDVETLIEDRCKFGISGLIISGDVIHPDSNNPILQKLAGAQLMDVEKAGRTTIRVIDITDPIVSDVAQSFDVTLGEIRKSALYPGTKSIAVTNSGVPVVFKRNITQSKACYIALGQNGQAVENIEVSRLFANALYDCMGTGWLQPYEAPTNVKAIVGDEKIKITWDKPKKMEGIAGYRVFRESENEKSKTIHDFALDTDTLFFEDSSVTNGKLYTYKICSIGNADKIVACSHQVQARPGKIQVTLPGWPAQGQPVQVIGSKHIVKGKTRPGSKVIVKWKLIPSGLEGESKGEADQNGNFEIPIDLSPGQKVEYYIVVENELGQEEKFGPYIVDCKANKIVISMTVGSKKAFVNGLEWPVDITPPFIVSKTGRTMVPFRFIGEHLGATVDWSPKDKAVETVTYKLNDVYIELFIGKKTAKRNGQQIELDQEPMIVKGSTMVPVRLVTEQLGSKVEWIQEARMVVITYPNPAP